MVTTPPEHKDDEQEDVQNEPQEDTKEEENEIVEATSSHENESEGKTGEGEEEARDTGGVENIEEPGDEPAASDESEKDTGEDKSEDAVETEEDIEETTPAETVEEPTGEEPVDEAGSEETEADADEDISIEEPKQEKKVEPKKVELDDDDSSLGLGPSEYVKPPVEAPKPPEAAPKPVTELTPEEEDFGMTIFAIKTAIGHEKMVADRIMSKARKRKLKVFSALSPTKLRGYVLLEAVNNRDAVKDLLKGLEHVRNVVDGETTLDEIEHFLTPKPLVFGIMEGDIVEIISGPFKGEKAKVQQIDESKEEITVELFEAMVSIPVTIRGDHVRVLEKESA